MTISALFTQVLFLAYNVHIYFHYHTPNRYGPNWNECHFSAESSQSLSLSVFFWTLITIQYGVSLLLQLSFFIVDIFFVVFLAPYCLKCKLYVWPTVAAAFNSIDSRIASHMSMGKCVWPANQTIQCIFHPLWIIIQNVGFSVLIPSNAVKMLQILPQKVFCRNLCKLERKEKNLSLDIYEWIGWINKQFISIFF